MSYSGHKRTPPRSILVIVGGMIAWMGMVGGVLITTPEYHRALTMKAEPVEMTWQQLVEQGLTDNSYVCLTDVELDQSDPLDMFEDMLAQFDPEAPIEEQQEAFELAAENMDIGQIAATVMQPIKVYPKGQDPSQVPARIVVPQTAWATEAAFQEVEASGTLTGRFTLTHGEGFEMQLTKTLLAGTEAAVEQALQDELIGEQADNGSAEDNAGEINADENNKPEDEAVAVAGDVDPPLQGNADDDTRWVFEPVHSVPNVAEAQQWFWLSALAVAVGMVICGAGGPSLTCCFFFQGPAILSILGYPMRYGRAGRTTRIVYAGIGIGLLGWGYQKMIVEAQFGQVNGDVALAVLGFLSGSFGAAALLGSVTNVVAERLNVSLDPKTTKKNAEPKMSFTEACSLEPTEANMATHYIDPQLVSEFNAEIPEAMQEIADALSGVGFGSGEPVVWMKDEVPQPTRIQLGCQDMVVADVDQVDGEVRTRLVSVLHDGIVVATLSGNTPSQKPLRFGTSGLYSISQSDDPVEMLSAHLEQTVSMAEKRDTAVVTIDVSETTDVVLHARRVLADVRAQYGEELLEVGDARHGRFAFPIAPIPQLETA